MGTRVTTQTVHDATTGKLEQSVEIATVVHQGREFTAHGSCIDLEKGHILGYVREGHGHLRGKYFTLGTFDGEYIAVLNKTGEGSGFPDRSGRHSRITHFSMEYAGFRWHGKCGLDWNQLVHLRRGKAL